MDSLGLLTYISSNNDFAAFTCDSEQTAIKLLNEINMIDPGTHANVSEEIVVTEDDIPKILREIFGDETTVPPVCSENE